MSNECQSCKAERAAKKPPLAPVDRVQLPAGVTDTRNFKRPHLPTYVCSYCDGETLISSAVRTFEKRQEAE